MLLVITVSILPLGLFHHHDSGKRVSCENSYTQPKTISNNQAVVLITIQPVNEHEDCLFCNWQMGTKLTYVIPEIVVFLPDFVKSKLSESHLTSVEILAFTDIPNKGPPAFLLF